MSTITETFINEYFADEESLVDVAPYIRITAANCSGIPYRGYFEADVTVWSDSSKYGFLGGEDIYLYPHTVIGVLKEIYMR